MAMVMEGRKAMRLLTVSLALISMISCSQPRQYSTHITLEGGEKPTFVLAGSGLLGDFMVYGPRQRPGENIGAITVWEIRPLHGPDGEPLKKLGSIKYGVVPKGYKQIYPEDGLEPPVIKPGVRYAYWAQIVNAPHAREEFELIDGKATEIPGNR
jgi:hypothetical protein